MSFNLDKDSSNSVINYYYTDYTIYPKENDPSNIKQVFLSKEPNISSPSFSSNYKSTNLYISKNIHQIENVQFDGELIIEHIPITNGTSKLYLCIPLKTVIGTSSILDDVIKNKKAVTINLNSILPATSTGILYDSTFLPIKTSLADHVLILSQPILVSTDFSDCHKANLFQPYSSEYQLISVTQYRGPIVEGFQEGLDQNMYCQPVDVNDQSDNDLPTISIPIVGADAKGDSTNVIMALVNNFTIFFIVLLGLWFIVPFGYNIFLVDHINIAQSNLNLSMKQKAGRLSASDTIISIFLLIMSISFIYTGTAGANANFTVVGFFMFISFIIIFLRIQYMKQFEKSGGYIGFLKSAFAGSSGDVKDEKDAASITPDFYGTIIGSFKSLYEGKQIVTVAILFTFLYGIIYLCGLKTADATSQLIWGLVFAILSIFIGVYAASTVKVESSSPPSPQSIV